MGQDGTFTFSVHGGRLPTFAYASPWRLRAAVNVWGACGEAGPFSLALCRERVRASAADEEGLGCRHDAADTRTGFLPACLRVACCPAAGLLRGAQRAVCTGRPRRQGCAQSCPGRAVACVTTQTLGGPRPCSDRPDALMGGVDRSAPVLPPPPPSSCRWAAARPSCCCPGCCFCPEFPPLELPRNLSFHTLLPAWCGLDCVPPGTCEGDRLGKKVFSDAPVKIVTLGEGGGWALMAGDPVRGKRRHRHLGRRPRADGGREE